MPFDCCLLREQILNAECHIVVKGGPGCGKTTVALQKALQRIKEGLLPGQAVLFLSFSRSAVARIVEAARDDLSKEIRRHLDIHTFHSFCWHIIRCHGYLLGAPSNILLIPPHEERTIRKGEKIETIEWLEERERLFYEEGKIVFDLFAKKSLELLHKSTAIQRLISSIYPLIIVDEAQDTGTEQWGCIEILAKHTQILCLADLDQQIYDFRKDVSPERLNQIINVLTPLEVDLGGENRRSPHSEIVTFGNDVLSGVIRGKPYIGIYHQTFNPKAEERDKLIRQATGIVRQHMRVLTGNDPKSIGYFTSWGKGVAIIAQALQGGNEVKPIKHRVIMEDVESFLASRVVALCLEPIKNIYETLAEGIELLSAIYTAQGKADNAEKLLNYAAIVRNGEIPPRIKLVKTFKLILEEISSTYFLGIPRSDWESVTSLFRNSDVIELKNIAKLVTYILGFNRGKRIVDSLSAVWEKNRYYKNARLLVEESISHEQLTNGTDTLDGINVMTMHKSKGKEFDCVIILHIGNNISPFSPNHEKPPYAKSRRLLRVAITRAKHCVLLLTDRFSASPLLKGHNLVKR
jgi:DNA helicase-2/ATP-dependent DNA helicase PcrA